MRIAALLLGILSGLVCFGAGVYLIAFRSSAAESASMNSGTFVHDATVMDVIAHGVGACAIGTAFALWSFTAFAFARTAPAIAAPSPMPQTWR